jgi:hypothetical protein
MDCCLFAGTDITPIVPALEKIWRDSKGQQLSDFNFRTVTSKFNELVYQYPIRCERVVFCCCGSVAAVGLCKGARTLPACSAAPSFHMYMCGFACACALYLKGMYIVLILLCAASG